MTTPSRRAWDYASSLLNLTTFESLADRLNPDFSERPPHVPGGAVISPEALARRWRMLGAPADCRAQLLDEQTVGQMDAYRHSIENFIGTVKLPVGLAGPLRVNGLFAKGDYYLPLATTEAALVASYSRGARLITEAGGASALLLNEGVSRAPAFAFATFQEAGRFLAWLLTHQEDLRAAAEATTRHGKLVDIQISVEGNHVFLILVFTTGDAAGQNMATIATEAALTWILAQSPVRPRKAFVEANFSGDKKASAQSFQSVRGKKVSAEVRIPAPLVQARLHTTVADMVECSQMATMGGILSGTVGTQGHYANGLAAMFIACGQDAACVAEAAVGVTRVETTADGDLYAAVTLPNLIVGSVGGGTGLPSQRACLEIMGLAGPGHARALAELAAALCLAGELSIIGAVSAGEFTPAHAKLARGTRASASPETL